MQCYPLSLNYHLLDEFLQTWDPSQNCQCCLLRNFCILGTENLWSVPVSAHAVSIRCTPKQTLLFWLARYQNQNLQKRAKQHFVFFSTSATCNLFGFNNRELAGGRNFIKRRRWWNKSQIREEPLWLELSSEQTPRKLLCLSPASSVSVSKRTTWWPFLKRYCNACPYTAISLRF